MGSKSYCKYKCEQNIGKVGYVDQVYDLIEQLYCRNVTYLLRILHVARMEWNERDQLVYIFQPYNSHNFSTLQS